jgi:hypothetical protein
MSMDHAIQNSTLMQSKIQGTNVCYEHPESLEFWRSPVDRRRLGCMHEFYIQSLSTSSKQSSDMALCLQ